MREPTISYILKNRCSHFKFCLSLKCLDYGLLKLKISLYQFSYIYNFYKILHLIDIQHVLNIKFAVNVVINSIVDGVNQLNNVLKEMLKVHIFKNVIYGILICVVENNVFNMMIAKDVMAI